MNLLIITDDKKIATDNIKKCRKLVYKRFKKVKNILVEIYVNNRLIDTLKRNEKGVMESVNGFPLYI